MSYEPDILKSESAPVYLVKSYNEFPHIEATDILEYIDSIFVLEQDYSAYVLQCFVGLDNKGEQMIQPLSWCPTVWWNYPAPILMKRRGWLSDMDRGGLDIVAKMEYDTLIKMVT